MDVEETQFTSFDFYNILHYLHEVKVDRQYPLSFDKSVFVEGDKIVLPVYHSNFDGVDDVIVFLNCHGVNVDVAKIVLGFSLLSNGIKSVESIDCSDTELDLNNDTLIQFNIDENYVAEDRSRKLTGIRTITLTFNEDATGVEIQNVVFNSKDYSYTYEDFKKAYDDGLNYVFRRLNDGLGELREELTVPKSLQKYVYMAAGAFAWLIIWEREAKPMESPENESKNYSDRLLGQVNDALNRYITNIRSSDEYFNLNSRVDWGIR